jgi:GNAT superfamily N-acetyltransferase
MANKRIERTTVEQSAQRYFGSPDNRRIQRNAEAIWRLIGADNRFCCHGRAVSLAEGTNENIPLQASLAHLQGIGICDSVPAADVHARRLALRMLGLQVERLEIFRGQGQPLTEARSVIAQTALPEDLSCISIDEQTSSAELSALDAFTQEHGASLPMASFLLAKGRRSVCYLARDRAGNIVGSCAAGAHFQPGHRCSDEAFWGMLATRDDRRGQGIAVYLGATAMLAMAERHGFETFLTAVKQGNTASERVCTKLGLQPNGTCALFAIDPTFFTR